MAFGLKLGIFIAINGIWGNFYKHLNILNMPFKLKMHIFSQKNWGKRYFPLGMVPINDKKTPQEKSVDQVNVILYFTST